MAYGIDLGTTYSAIAKIRDTGRPDIITNQQDASDTLPSAIYFDDSGNVIIGAAAKEVGLEHPERLFQYFKRYIGRDNDPDAIRYEVDGKAYNPVELSAVILKKIKEYAEQSGESVNDVVITVPAYFNLAQRQATIQAGNAAGLNVLATINEPTAAALSYCFDSMEQDRTVLVYDLGGGTFDVTLLKISAKKGDGSTDAVVLATAGDAKLGGYDWDKRLYELMLQKYADENGMDVSEIDPEVSSIILSGTEKLKQDLSNREEADLKFRDSGERKKITVTRKEFAERTADLLNKTVILMDGILENAKDQKGITEDDIDLVLEVGGSTRMPQVQEMLQVRFQDKVRFYEPDKAVAMGAAIAAEMLSKDVDIEKFNVEIEKLTSIKEKLSSGRLDLEKTEVKISDDKQTVELIDLSTNETTKVDTAAFSQEYQDKIERGDSMSAEDIMRAQAAPKVAKAINVYDVAPSTFGVVVQRPDQSGYISDNLIKKDSQTPCETMRQYAIPGGASIHLILPVTESNSTEDQDAAIKEGAGKYNFPDSSKGMKVKAQLNMEVEKGLPRGTIAEVTVAFDRYANLHVTMLIPSTGTQKELNVNFSPVSEDAVEEMKNTVAGLAFIDDLD